ncbi:MAG: glycosyltransferase [Candidatus Paceibacterota bacterium]
MSGGKKPHVLHVITGLEVGGAEAMLVKTLPKLTGYEHTVCTVLNDGPLAAPLREAGIRVVNLQAGSKGLWQAVRGFRLLAKEKPDLMISYLIHADLFTRFLAPLFGIKRRVAFIRNNLIGSKYHKLLLMERWTQWLVQSYFSVSQSVADMYVEKLGYPRKKFTVIANGIEEKPFLSAQPLSKKELGLSEKDVAVLMVGKFFAQKGHTYLIEAWPQVLEKFPQARLLLAGGGPLEQEIKGMVTAADLDNSVRFLGVRSDVPRLLKTCDVFVFPTLFEGMSNALLEAMISECAIVTTDIPENREVATEEEVVFVPSRNATALAQALNQTLQDEKMRKEMGKKARARVERDFIVSRTVATLNAAYERSLTL